MYKFPKGFLFGWSQSAFQFEMGIKGDEDPNSDWYVWVHDRENISAGLVSGDLPENGPGYWHNYKIFHENAEKMGLKIVRAEAAWTRIFPNPTFDVKVDAEIKDGKITHVSLKESDLEKLDSLANKDAINHYKEIFKDLKDRGIEIILNVYFWPLPLWLHDPIAVRKGVKTEKDGWLSVRTVVEFAKFAAYIAWKFAEITSIYSTINEPNAIYNNGYRNVKSGFPPGYLSLEYYEIAKHNLIQAHARAYDVIKERDKRNFIGIVYAGPAFTPYREEDREVVERAKYDARWSFLDWIIFGTAKEDEFREDLKGKLDWIGINYYTRSVIRSIGNGYASVPGYGYLCGEGSISLDGRPCTDTGSEVYPEGIYEIIKDYWNRYHLPIYVTENGLADEADRVRPYFIVSHVYQVYRAIQEGIDVRGYLHWSLTDNYEWSAGFGKRYGLLYVDYETKRLYWRPSAFIYKEIAENQEITDRIEYLVKLSRRSRK